MKYRAKPVLVRAAQVDSRAYDDMAGEAARLRNELGLSDESAIVGGDLLGHILVGDETARPSNWLVRLPNDQIIILYDHMFWLLFEPAAANRLSHTEDS